MIVVMFGTIILTIQGLVLRISGVATPCMGRHGMDWTWSSEVHERALRAYFLFSWDTVNMCLTTLKRRRKMTTLPTVSTSVFVLSRSTTLLSS